MKTFSRSGVSLLEMIVVVMIISILAGGAGMYYTGVIEQTRKDRAYTDLRQLAKMLVKYESERGLPIQTLGDISDVDSLGIVYEPNLKKLLEYQIVTQLPDDPWGLPYRIDIPGGIIYSCGPDSVTTTFDDVTVIFRPAFEPKWARLTSNKVYDQIEIEFSRPVKRSILTTAFFSIAGSGIVTWTTAVVDMWNGNNVLLRLDGVLPDTCTGILVREIAFVEHLEVDKPLQAVDAAILTSSVIVEIER